jgi:hypothetical protein
MRKKPETLADITTQRINANQHTQRGMGMLEKSIDQRKWIGAITAAADGEIFDGSARREVLEAIGVEDAIIVHGDGTRPLIYIRDDIPTADDPRAVLLGIEANRIPLVNIEFDPGILAGIAGRGVDLSGLWFPDEWADVAMPALPEAGDGGDDFDPTPEDGPTRTALGELWRIGGVHRLLIGDCTDAANVARLMGGDRAALGIHDPPYGIDASGMTMGSGESAKPKATRLSHNQEWDGARPDVTHLLSATDYVCIWGGNYFADVLPITNDWLCWWKNNDNLSFSEFELAWTNYGKNARHLTHHWGGEEKEHITQKPLAVIEWCITQCPGEPHSVADFYAGSGTTLIAAHRTDRRCFGMEIAPRYADVILRRAEAEGLECERVDE